MVLTTASSDSTKLDQVVIDCDSGTTVSIYYDSYVGPHSQYREFFCFTSLKFFLSFFATLGPIVTVTLLTHSLASEFFE